MIQKIIRAIVVDDEQDAREILCMLLEDIPEVQVIGTADRVDRASTLVLDQNPDLIFLDIEMPEKSGFDMIHELEYFDQSPAIIFTTAFNKYAIDAIRHAAFDYLLKPINRSELQKSIQRYLHVQHEKSFAQKTHMLLEHLYPKQLRYKTLQGYVFIRPDEIAYCVADGNYTNLYLKDDKKIFVSEYLSVVEQPLPVDQFCRISRSVIINLQFLFHINKQKKKCQIKRGSKLNEFAMSAKGLTLLEKKM